MNATDIHHNPVILARLVSQQEDYTHTVSRRQPSQVLRVGEDIYFLHEGKIKGRIPLSEAEFFASIDETSDYSITAETIEDKFHRLADGWREESQLMSSSGAMARLESYQSIIQMGRVAIPLILRELEREPDHWFIALETITGENPVPNDHRGIVGLMAEDWLRWGREQA
jgi:hypothetical protein